MSEYKTTVGIEVHAELKTKSKMFCGCKNDPHAGEPNTHTCPVCLAHPGTLPVVNKSAIEKVLLVGAAIGGTLASYSEFDRKNYFYPDIPKAYQISQYAYPFVLGGEIAGVAITRIHLEEDTARSQHDQESGSLVDFNRAGVPLMELVTEPVIHDAATAGAFARELQLLLRMLDVSDANMERGEMRVEANISVSNTDQMAKTYVEVKNLNSFKAMEAAIEYETKRQIQAKEAGEHIVQETRGWDEAKSKTFSQRTKESANDYRYFPDPDIPKFDIDSVPEFSRTRLAEMLPKLAPELRSLYRDCGLAENQVEVILQDSAIRNYFAAVYTVAKDQPKLIALAANYLSSDVLGLLQKQSDLQLVVASAPSFVTLMQMVLDGDLNSRGAKDLLVAVVFEHENPREMATKQGLVQQNNEAELLPIIKTIIADNQAVVAEYKAGKEASLKYLLGQAMKATKGAGNPHVLEELLKKTI